MKTAMIVDIVLEKTNLCCTKRSISISLTRAGRGELLLMRLNYNTQQYFDVENSFEHTRSICVTMYCAPVSQVPNDGAVRRSNVGVLNHGSTKCLNES